jgi:hypothetical protein
MALLALIATAKTLQPNLTVRLVQRPRVRARQGLRERQASRILPRRHLRAQHPLVARPSNITSRGFSVMGQTSRFPQAQILRRRPPNLMRLIVSSRSQETLLLAVESLLLLARQIQLEAMKQTSPLMPWGR